MLIADWSRYPRPLPPRPIAMTRGSPDGQRHSPVDTLGQPLTKDRRSVPTIQGVPVQTARRVLLLSVFALIGVLVALRSAGAQTQPLSPHFIDFLGENGVANALIALVGATPASQSFQVIDAGSLPYQLQACESLGLRTVRLSMQRCRTYKEDLYVAIRSGGPVGPVLASALFN